MDGLGFTVMLDVQGALESAGDATTSIVQRAMNAYAECKASHYHTKSFLVLTHSHH